MKLFGIVASAPEFKQQHLVLNGARERGDFAEILAEIQPRSSGHMPLRCSRDLAEISPGPISANLGQSWLRVISSREAMRLQQRGVAAISRSRSRSRSRAISAVGCSDVMMAVLGGKRGYHARSAIGEI